MKRIAIITISILTLAALASSCVTEPQDTEGMVPQGSKTITFRLPRQNNSMTYVSSVGDEDVMNGMAIYMFNSGTKKLERIFREAEITYGTGTSGQTTATIDVTERTGSKTFFFVANHAGISSEIDKARFNETVIEDFEQSLTDVQTTLPKTPLLMSFRQVVADVQNVDSTEVDIKMTRRVARFDIKNDASVTNFKIKNIIITDVNQQAHVFGDAPAIPGEVLASGDITPSIVFDTIPGANGANPLPAVFYTYPTTIGPGKTDITFEGELHGVTRMFSLAPSKTYEIEANKRYTLLAKAVPENKIEFEITVKDWEEGTTIDAGTQDSSIVIPVCEVVYGNGELSDDKRTLDFSYLTGDMTTILKFTTQTYRSEGTRIEIEYKKGTAATLPIVINSPKPVLTYGARYEQEYVAEFTNKSLDDTEAVIKIINIADPFRSVFLTVKRNTPSYPGAEAKAIPVNGVYWAPVNVGATTWNNTTSVTDMGNLFQWGREYVSWPYGDTSGGTASNSQNNVTVASARTFYSTQFITYYSGTGNWCGDDNSSLWSGDNDKGPCPDGWRLPSKEEVDKLVAVRNKMVWEGNALKVPSDMAGYDLRIPLGGYRDQSNGNYGAINSYGYYWGSGISGNQSYAFTPNSSPTSTSISLMNRAFGAYVRCVVDR